MGKKRKIEEDIHASYEEDRAPVEYNQQDQHAGGSRVEAETVSYLQEVSQHFSTLVDYEEKELLLANVLEEIQDKELRIASDAVTSRLLEQLLVGAPASQLMQFLQAFTNEDLMFSLAGSAFGSHVAEKVLAGLHGQADQLDEQQAEQLQELMSGMVGAIGSNLFDYIMDKHATHVARALLVVIAGRDVLSPVAKKKQQQQQQQQVEEGSEQQQAAAAAAAAGNAPAFKSTRSSLQEKIAGRSSTDLPPVRYPALLRRYSKMLPCYDASNMSMLGKNSYSSPFIQAVLRAAAGDEELLLLLLPPILGVDSSKAAAAEPGQLLSSLTDSHMGRLLRDDCYSHLLEVVMTVMPKGLSDEFYLRFLKGRMLPLTNHHSANFVIQAWLAALNDATMVQSALTELSPHFTDLLKRRRSGVLAAVMAAAGRAGAAAQQAAAAALASALAQLPQWQSREGTDHLAPALLTLDTFATMGSSGSQQQQQRHGSSSEGVRLSTPGSAILATIFTSYSRKAAKPFVQSVLSLNPADAVRAAKDPAGSRALQALVEGTAAGSESKSQLLSKLSGSWGDIALQAAGSFFLEKCYSWSDLHHKEVIVSDVAGRQSALMSGCYWGHKLIKRLGVEAYLRSPDEWRKRASSTAAAARAFEQMLAGDTSAPQAAAAGGEGKKRKRRQQQQGVSTPETAAAPAAADAVGGGSSTSGKKVKKKSRLAAEAEATATTTAAAATAAVTDGEERQEKKKKKKHKQSDNSAAAAAPDPALLAADQTLHERDRKRTALAAAALSELVVNMDDISTATKKKKEKKKRKRTSSPGQEAVAVAADAAVGGNSTDDLVALLTFGGNAAAAGGGGSKGQRKRHRTG